MATEDLSPTRLLTRREAAAFLGIGCQTLANWSSTGRGGVPFIRLSRRLIRYRQADLVRWLNDRVVTHTGQVGAAEPDRAL